MRKTRTASFRSGARPRTHAKAHATRKDSRRSRTSHSIQATQAVSTRPKRDEQYLAAIKGFELAVQQFTKQNLEKAKPLFEKLAASVYPEVADRARLYLRLCQQKLERSAPAPKTAADYYALGVAELNARNLDPATEHLSKADKMQPKREHIRFALAAAYALQGNSEAALEHLKAAIQLRPGNAYQARHDEDFQSLRSHPAFRSLVRADASASASTS